MNVRNTNNFKTGSAFLLAAAAGAMFLSAPVSACDEHPQTPADVSIDSEHVVMHPALGEHVVFNVLSDDDEDGGWVMDIQDDGDRRRGRSFSRAFVAEVDDNGNHVAHEVKVEVDDEGQANVWIDGDQVPADRMRREGGRIIVLDENGNEVRSVRIWDNDDRGWMQWRNRGDDENGRSFALRFNGDMDVNVAPPPVMLGVYMETPGPALCKQLKLDEETSTLVTGVYDGLSADRAGLEVYDIIVSINGDDDAGPAKLRQALREQQPGATIALGVIHEGEQQTVKVELDAFDRELMRDATLHGHDGTNRRIGRELVITPFPQRPDDAVFVAPNIDDLNVDAREVERIVREAIRNALRHTEDIGQFDADELHRRLQGMQPDVDQHMERLNRRMMEMERMLQRMERRLHRKQSGVNDDDDNDDGDIDDEA